MLDYSTFFVFGGEESYGYLASDKLRDKDANAAVVMFCELAAYLKAQEMTFPSILIRSISSTVITKKRRSTFTLKVPLDRRRLRIFLNLP